LLAKRGWLTQFQNPRKDEKEKPEKSRLTSGVLDMYRQFGMLDVDLVKELEAGGIKPGTRIIGLHIKKANQPTDWKNASGVWLPLAVSITVGERSIKAMVPDDKTNNFNKTNWIPYRDAQLSLGRRIGKNLDLEDYAGIGIVQRIFELSGNEDTILYVGTENWRHIWTWLQNSKFEYDKMDLGDDTFYPQGVMMPFNGRRLTSIRVIRFRAEDETPSYNTFPKSKDNGPGNGHGVWPLNERVWYSISSKPDSYKPRNDYSRFGGYGQHQYARTPQIFEFIPMFIQPGDEPQKLALTSHILRSVAPHWRSGMTNTPLPVHLAMIAADDYLSMQYLENK
jgi:hypothetical protein